ITDVWKYRGKSMSAIASTPHPSWRRICKTLIKNDFWCRTLSFSPNKPRHYERYLQRMKERRKEWGTL
ncbi:DUF3440 domain-containing protein, partial [Shigella flexneri]|uniref:DUF3440 domain-containing protein n=1 Tax=Shigella flexneri TaxID=623 RepID=UPI003F5418F6